MLKLGNERAKPAKVPERHRPREHHHLSTRNEGSVPCMERNRDRLVQKGRSTVRNHAIEGSKLLAIGQFQARHEQGIVAPRSA